MLTSLNLWIRVFFATKGADIKSLDFAVVRFLMKLFNSANIDVINDCRWYFEFELPGDVLAKKRAKF